MNNQQIIEKLTQDGFVLLRNILTKKECLDYVASLERIYNKQHKLYANTSTSSTLADKSSEKVVYNLHNKEGHWMQLLDHDIVHQIIGPLLKQGSYKNSEPFYLYNSSARTPLLGNPGQQIHVDSNLPGINYPLMINALWYFEDADADNGATVVVPNTIDVTEFAEDGKSDYESKIIVEARAGDVLLFNANLWHGGGPNIDGRSRWAAVLGYARWFIKPSFDTIRNTSEATYNEMTERQKGLLGFHLNPPKDEYERITRRTVKPEPPRK